MRLSFVLKVLLLIKMYTILIAEEDIFELEFEDVRLGMEEEDGSETIKYINKKDRMLGELFEPKEYMRICYFANWAAKRQNNISRVTPEDVDPFLCTHINFAFGKVSSEKLEIQPYEEDDMQGWTGGPGMYERIINLKKNNSRLKVMLSIGGWTHASKGFNEVVQNDKSIETFVQNSIKFLRKFNFDGLDIDWEYPGATDRQAEKNTKKGFTKLIRRLREAYEEESYKNYKPRLLLSAAVAAAVQRINDGYEVQKVCEHFDFINVMSYDYHGSWDEVTGHNSPLYGRKGEPKKEKLWNINASMYIWVEKGCPKEKLNVGIAAYGRTFSMYSEKQSHEIGVKASAGEAGEHTREPGVLSYYEICQVLKKDKSIKIYWHKEHDVPYAYKPGLWIGFDNQKSLINKCEYVKRHKFGGVIVWSLDMDDKTGMCNQGSFPVFNTLKKVLTEQEPLTGTPKMSTFPRGFWSKQYHPLFNSNQRMFFNYSIYYKYFFSIFLFKYFLLDFLVSYLS